MSGLTSTEVRRFLQNYLGRKLEAREGGPPKDLPEDCDLLASGIISDSIDFLDLLVAIEEFAGLEIDFEPLDPEQMSVVGPLSRFVSEQTGKAEIANEGREPEASHNCPGASNSTQG